MMSSFERLMGEEITLPSCFPFVCQVTSDWPMGAVLCLVSMLGWEQIGLGAGAEIELEYYA
jgi:hypothetical protein